MKLTTVRKKTQIANTSIQPDDDGDDGYPGNKNSYVPQISAVLNKLYCAVSVGHDAYFKYNIHKKT